METKVRAFAKELNERTEIDIFEYLEIDDIIEKIKDGYDSTDLFEDLDCRGCFQVDIIGYANAMEYLRENDCSLKNSLTIAGEYGYDVEDLSSEILATLLVSKMREEGYWNEIEALMGFYLK